MKLWLDDVRTPPNDGSEWDWARTAEVAIARLAINTYEMASLDHDLGVCERHGYSCMENCLQSGYDVALYLERNPEKAPKLIVLHSWNPAGARRMAEALKSNRYKVVVKPAGLL